MKSAKSVLDFIVLLAYLHSPIILCQILQSYNIKPLTNVAIAYFPLCNVTHISDSLPINNRYFSPWHLGFNSAGGLPQPGTTYCTDDPWTKCASSPLSWRNYTESYWHESRERYWLNSVGGKEFGLLPCVIYFFLLYLLKANFI